MEPWMWRVEAVVELVSWHSDSFQISPAGFFFQLW